MSFLNKRTGFGSILKKNSRWKSFCKTEVALKKNLRAFDQLKNRVSFVNISSEVDRSPTLATPPLQTSIASTRKERVKCNKVFELVDLAIALLGY